MLNYKLHFILLLLSLLMFAGCATHNNNIYESPKKQTYLPYSDLARISHLSLKHDGYIIGIEKRPRKDVAMSPQIVNERKRFSTINIPDSHPTKTDKEMKRFKRNVQIRNKKFTNYISDNSIMFVSHVASYFEDNVRRPEFLYNSYKIYKDDRLDYEHGYGALKKLGEDLKRRLENKAYTHIILFCMGWNNNQEESIYRYNTIVANLQNIAPEKDFKPIIIGFTWPSVWFSIEDSWLKKNALFLASYFTKQDDADEIGVTIANWVTHNVVLKANKDANNANPAKVLAIGHSMGARILSRAIFSNEYIRPDFRNSTSESDVNLFIGLQGAFSANRFIAYNGWEGSPYAEFSDRKTEFSLTTSRYDKANPIAAFITGAKHTGGKHGLRVAKKSKNEKIFNVIEWTDNTTADTNTLSSLSNKDRKKVIMIDASKIVDGYDVDHGVNKPNDAHNDILDTDMAELIWALINNFAKYSNKN